MKPTVNELEKMIENGLRDITQEQIELLIEEELSKDESEIDTDFIDMCFRLSELPEAGKKITIRSRKRILLIAAAIVVLCLSTLTVAAQSGSIDPVKKLSTLISSEKKESTTKRQTTNQNYYSYSQSKCIVPDFLAETYNEQDIRSNNAWNNSFDIIYAYDYSNEVADGYVLAQSVEAGKRVNKGTRIVITISLGEKLEDEYAVPNFVGSDHQTIESVEEYSSHFVISYNYVVASEDEIGIVISQSIPAGEIVPIGTEIVLTVATVEPTNTTLPDVTSQLKPPMNTEVFTDSTLEEKDIN